MRQIKDRFKKSRVSQSFLIASMVVTLSSCSSFSDIVDSTGASLASVGGSLQSVTSDVQVVQVSEDTFDLTQNYHEPVTNFESWPMRVKAKKVCDEGYIYQSRHAFRTGEFAKDNVACVDGASCGYALEWRIQCKKVPYEPFSLFGKT